MTFRSRKLLNLAHDFPCQAEFPHDCNDLNGCDPAHADWSEFGRGIGHKAADCFFAAMCPNAHKMISAQINPPFTRDERKHHWMRAFIRTIEYMWDNGKVRVA